jgi:hypothetical protein
VTQKHVARHAGKLRKLLVATSDLCAATETMTFDVQLNGVSVFSTTPQLANVSSPVGVYDVMGLVAAAVNISVGDVISVVRTLANGSTLTSTAVVVEWG